MQFDKVAGRVEISTTGSDQDEHVVLAISTMRSWLSLFMRIIGRLRLAGTEVRPRFCLLRSAPECRRRLLDVWPSVLLSQKGQVEGQVNRLKMLNRQMYGRAKLDLLRARVLPMAQAA